MGRRGARRDEGKERFWRRLLRQWQRSGLTVRDFCVEHALAKASFYAWRRRLAALDSEATLGTGPRREAGASQGQPVFVPLRVTPAPTPARGFEVVLGAERVVRVPACFDPAALRQLLAILEEGSSC